MTEIKFPDSFELHQVFKTPPGRGEGYWTTHFDSFPTLQLAKNSANKELKNVPWVIFERKQVASSS